MLHIAFSILGMLLTILFVIGTHEAAHFYMARAVGVKVLRFSIGFGKTLFRWHDKSGTEYVFALLPLGGYVKMLGESDDKEIPPDDLHRAYHHQPFYKKFLIVLAGPVSNILCAFLLYWLIFMLGFVTIKPVIGSITPNSIAAKAGMQPMQAIERIDGNITHTWTGAAFRLLVHIGTGDQIAIATKKLTTQETKSYSLDTTSWKMNDLTPDPLTSLGIVPYEPSIPLIIGVINQSSPAAQSGLKINDKILAIAHQPMKNWLDIMTIIQQHPNQTVKFIIERKGKKKKINVNIGYQRDLWLKKIGYLGIAPTVTIPPELLETVKYTPLAALSRAGEEITNFTYFNLVLFGKMFTGKLSLHSLGGPITIFTSAGETLNYSWIAFIGFLAFLSLSIGIINFLPIPGLDGGHLLMQIIELIIRRPIPDRIQSLLIRLGFAFLIWIFIQAVVNDVLRLF